MTCVSCGNAAEFIYEISPVHTIPYCFNHLPKFLQNQKNAGMLKTPDDFAAAKADAVAALDAAAAKKAKKAKEAPVEEAPVEDSAPTEEAPSTPAE
jgi:hypothetical protein